MVDYVTSDTIILYGHGACPGVPPAIGMLKQAKAPYNYIDIHKDMEARHRVSDLNNGYESVPTLEFPDGTTLTEPTASELRNKLQGLGYKVPITALIVGNLPMIITALVMIFAVLRFLEVI